MGNLISMGATLPIRWGILGSGRVAEGFATGLASVPGAKLTAVASRRRSTADAFASRRPDVRVHTSYDELVDDPDIDVVYVATPNDRHAADAIKCLRHGKAVLCEKPFTTDAEEARDVIAEATARGLFCMEGMWMRFIPAVRRAVDLVEAGAIGDVRTVHADFSHPVALDPENRVFDRERGGGALLDLGVYTLSLAQMILGEPDAVAGHLAIGDTGVDEHCSISLGYPSGASATLTASVRALGPNRAVIAGSAGTIRLPGPICAPTSLVVEPVREMGFQPSHSSRRNRFVAAAASNRHAAPLARRARAATRALLRTGRRTIRIPLTSNGYNYEAAEVVRCLRAGEAQSRVMPLDDSLRTMELIDRIRSDCLGPALGR